MILGYGISVMEERYEIVHDFTFILVSLSQILNFITMALPCLRMFRFKSLSS